MSDQLNTRIAAQIDALGSSFASVTFIKKDGTLRTLTIQQAAMASRILGTERGEKASATRAINHPNLKTVWSVHDNGFRTINLDTVTAVKSGGTTSKYRDVRSYVVPVGANY